jgi:hypothetical protein
MLYRSLERLARDDVTSPGALLVFRCASETSFDVPSVWQPERRLDYSSMEVHLFRKAPAAEETPEGSGSAGAAKEE